MSCPYHKKAAESESAAAAPAAATAPHPVSEGADASKCPFAGKQASSTATAKPHGDIADLKPGDEMCSHARKKMERERLAAEAAQQDGRPQHLPQQDWAKASGEDLKSHFTMAYNLVADDVARRGRAHNAKIAAVLMRRLGYTEEDMKVIGNDAWVMQGTGNPHALANVQPGETVVDFGSGFGMDAFIAASRAGPAGRVIGIDLSLGEVSAAIKRANERRLRNVDFRLGDMEDTPFEDKTVDVVISNGGFCLVPDKDKAFGEIFRILRPGGRFTISCTTLRRELDGQYDWPSCFVVFMPLATIKERLEKLGFTDVEIDDSNARMDLWDEVKKEIAAENEAAAEEADKKEHKTTIHTGNPQFDFLKNLDMNDYCARVNVRAVKPAA